MNTHHGRPFTTNREEPRTRAPSSWSVALARQAGSTSTRPLGRIQMANMSGAAVGPVVGGLLVSLVGWEALFLINVPLALAALLIVRKVAPADERREQGSATLLRPVRPPRATIELGT